MASADVCDPCLESNKTVHAEKYCSECEEKLCAECTESHRRFKAFKSHDVIDLSSIGARIPPSSKKTVKYTQTSRLIISVVNMMLFAVELVFLIAIALVKLLYL